MYVGVHDSGEDEKAPAIDGLFCRRVLSRTVKTDNHPRPRSDGRIPGHAVPEHKITLD